MKTALRDTRRLEADASGELVGPTATANRAAAYIGEVGDGRILVPTVETRSDIRTSETPELAVAPLAARRRT